jgi:hypothetical protein
MLLVHVVCGQQGSPSLAAPLHTVLCKCDPRSLPFPLMLLPSSHVEWAHCMEQPAHSCWVAVCWVAASPWSWWDKPHEASGAIPQQCGSASEALAATVLAAAPLPLNLHLLLRCRGHSDLRRNSSSISPGCVSVVHSLPVSMDKVQPRRAFSIHTSTASITGSFWGL